jgi:flagellar motility protein MotE (MotC chaperone)
VIVTRQRKKKPNYKPLLIPLALVAIVSGALSRSPSHAFIVDGPLKPLWVALGPVVRPLTFAGQQETINERNREIRDLSAQLEQQRQEKSGDDARVQQLQQQLAALESRPKTATPSPAPRRTAPATPATALAASGSATGGAAASEDEKRIAATWAAMDPEKAAAVVQRLPDAEVVRVLAAMDPDSAAGILNALPAAVAARLTRTGAQVSPSANR